MSQHVIIAVLVGVAVGMGGACSVPVSSSADAPSPLAHTFGSSEEVAEAVLDALAADDFDRLDALALNQLEFRTVVWPELPSSRPERGVPFDYAWGDLHQKSTNELRRLVHRAGGTPLELVSIGFDGESTVYETFTVHRESRLTVRDQEGTERDVQLFGSILQRGDEYKLFSYVVD